MSKHKEGIYFGMSDDEYHSLPYFSRSTADYMNFDLEEAYYNLFVKKKEQTPAMALGQAIHTAVLEPKTFDLIYVKKPALADYPHDVKILNTNDELKEFLTSSGQKKSGNKAELVERVRQSICDPTETIIWDGILREHEISLKEKGKKELSDADFKTIQEIQKSLKKRKIPNEILKEGYSEVTLIWEDYDTGIMCKCRIDRLPHNAVVELKSFSTISTSKPLSQQTKDTTISRKYNHQFASYLRALELLLVKIKKGEAEIFGLDDEEFKTKLLDSVGKKRGSFMIFARTQAPYQIKCIELYDDAGGTQNMYYSNGLSMYRNGLRKYAECLKQFGDEEWIEDKLEMLEDEDVPAVMYQNIGD